MEQDKFIQPFVNLDSIPETLDNISVLVPEELVKDAMTLRVIEEKYWYFNEAGSNAYLKLNSTGDKYRTFDDSKNLITINTHDILQTTLEKFQSWMGGGRDGSKNNPSTIDIISLGFGGGEKELDLLSVFLDKYTHDNNVLTFIPVELSFTFLIRGMRTTFKLYEHKISNKTLTIKPYLTDFTKTTSKDFINSEYVLITALGIVFNASIPDIFNSLHDIMTKKSLLLIDVEMVGGRSDDEICESYYDESAKKFFFSPMELLEKTSKFDRQITQNGRPIGNCKDFEGIELNYNEINPEIVSADNIDNFIKKYKLSPDAKKKIRISPDPKSKTVVIVYTPKDKPAYVLGYSTRFNESTFSEMLNNHGFSIVKQYTKPDSNTVYFLLELKRDDSLQSDSK